jgi:CheY-like chemotaxis protein
MGGEIGVESTVDVGSVFWITLHRSAAVAPVRDVELAPSERITPRDGEVLYTLLCVEDNPANLMLIEKLMLRRSDIRLLSAIDAISGIALARRELPDVILMDINLPGISGTAALKILRADPLTCQIPVIALSANAMPRDIERGLEAGYFQYLTKPINVRVLMTTLDAALRFATTLSEPSSQ